jgi:uncharacterized OB-fold protein
MTGGNGLAEEKTMADAPIAPGLFDVVGGQPHLIGGRRRRDGVVTFPMPAGAEAALYEPVALSPEGRLWSFTVQRFRPKSPPYAGVEDERGFRPYAVGYVELPGEVIVEARLEIDDFSALRVGLPMTLALAPFETADRGTAVSYVFRPAA